MPFIKRKKPGRFPAWGGSNAYEYIEVDQFGNPILGAPKPIQKSHWPEKSKFVEPDFVRPESIQPSRQDIQTKTPSLTEKKIAPGIRAPDKIKGFSKPFNYHLWNTLRSQGRVAKKK